MNLRLNRLASNLLIAAVAGPFLMASSIAAPLADASGKSDAALVSSVRDALTTTMGADATDLTVTATHGNVTLHGWTKGPKQESQARLVASKVSGVTKAYSQVHVWSATDEN